MPRIVYSLQFDLEVDGNVTQLIAPLDAHGQSPHCRACSPKTRVIDLRAGDYVQHGGKEYLIRDVSAYRDAHAATITTPPADGYIGARVDATTQALISHCIATAASCSSNSLDDRANQHTY